MKISASNCTALIIDFQEKLFPTIAENQKLLCNTVKLINGLKIFEVSVVYSQQNTNALGGTILEVKTLLAGEIAIEKMSFSCTNNSEYLNYLKQSGRKTVILAGIEAHICVLQTVIGLLHESLIPVVAIDCIGSSSEIEKNTAIKRMQQEGARITTSESLLFEMCGEAGTENFRKLLKLIKESK